MKKGLFLWTALFVLQFSSVAVLAQSLPTRHSGASPRYKPGRNPDVVPANPGSGSGTGAGNQSFNTGLRGLPRTGFRVKPGMTTEGKSGSFTRASLAATSGSVPTPKAALTALEAKLAAWDVEEVWPEVMQALAQHPQDADILEIAAHIAYHRGDYQESLTLINKSLKVGGENESRHCRGGPLESG